MTDQNEDALVGKDVSWNKKKKSGQDLSKFMCGETEIGRAKKKKQRQVQVPVSASICLTGVWR